VQPNKVKSDTGAAGGKQECLFASWKVDAIKILRKLFDVTSPCHYISRQA
jgi:hypothetical protein